MTAKNFTLVAAVTMLTGCAGMDIFGAPDEDIQNGLISGKPFVLDISKHPPMTCVTTLPAVGATITCTPVKFDFSKPVTVIPVDPKRTMPCNSTGCTNVQRNEIYIRQRPSVAAMMRDFRHEYEIHGSGGRHANDTAGQVRDELAERMEAERVINLDRMGIRDVLR